MTDISKNYYSHSSYREHVLPKYGYYSRFKENRDDTLLAPLNTFSKTCRRTNERMKKTENTDLGDGMDGKVVSPRDANILNARSIFI